MSVEIKLDDRQAKRQLKELAGEAKQAGQIKLDPEQPDRSGGRKQSGADKKNEGLRRKFGGGGDTTDQATSGMDEFEGGGFYESLKDKAEVLKKARDNTIKTAKWLKGKLTGKKGSGVGVGGENEDSSGRAGEQKIRQLIAETSQIRTLNIQNATIRNVRGQGSALSAPGGGVGAEVGVGSSPSNTRGFMAGAMGKSMPFVGAIAVAAGAMMKIVSDVGQRYVQSLMSQADTFGSTGQYVVGRGPRGLFRDAEIAQAEVAYAKAADVETFQRKTPLLSEDVMRFASRRNMNPAELGESLGVISRGQKEETSINYLRDYAEKSGFQAMRQGEAITKLSEAVRQLREQGFGELNVRQFAPIAAAFTQGREVVAERGLTIAQNLDQRVRRGEQGGLVGQLALVAKMQEGKDFFTARSELQSEGITGETIKMLKQYFGENNKQLLAYVIEMEGISTQREAEAVLDSKTVTLKDRTDRLNVAENPGIGFQNRSLEAFGTGAGARAGAAAVKIAETAQNQLITMLDNHAGEIESLARGIHDVEKLVFTKLSEGVDMMVDVVNDPGKYFGDFMSSMTDKFKDSMPGWMKF